LPNVPEFYAVASKDNHIVKLTEVVIVRLEAAQLNPIIGVWVAWRYGVWVAWRVVGGPSVFTPLRTCASVFTRDAYVCV
jgi:hypothetical protein